jgi:phosphopentomutase
LTEASVPVLGVGKIADILAHRGITEDVHAHGNDGLLDATLAALERAGGKAPIFTNSVDSDSEFAHRRDVAGYASTLEHFDTRLPELLCRLREGDLLVLCADHGNDPTWPGNDDTQEHIPVLLRGGGLRSGSHGIRSSFADTGQTLARHIGLPAMACATAFENAT